LGAQIVANNKAGQCDKQIRRLSSADTYSWFIVFWGISNFIQYKMYQLQYEGGKKRWHEGGQAGTEFLKVSIIS